jgi:hypothetical protein
MAFGRQHIDEWYVRTPDPHLGLASGRDELQLVVSQRNAVRVLDGVDGRMEARSRARADSFAHAIPVPKLVGART